MNEDFKVGKIEQLIEKRTYGHAPFNFDDAPNLRSKMVVMITDILMDDSERRSNMAKKAEKIVDLIIKCFK